MHLARVVHRDIKPANILLDRHQPDGVFLCDFGLGRDLDIATPEQLRDGAGTPLYMPPERLLRLCADEILCDVYALGATLYEAVTLVPPVQVPESLPWPAWTTYLATTKPEPPRTLRPDIPDALEMIILRLMARGQPEDRYTVGRATRQRPGGVPRALLITPPDRVALTQSNPRAPFRVAVAMREVRRALALLALAAPEPPEPSRYRRLEDTARRRMNAI